MNFEHKSDFPFCCGCRYPHSKQSVEDRQTTGVTRRDFLGAAAGGVVASAVLATTTHGAWETASHRPPSVKTLQVQPVFNCHIYPRQEATSWRVTGAIQDEAELREEENRIRADLKKLQEMADFPMEIRPLVTVGTVEEANAVASQPCDVMLVFAARRNVPVLEALIRPERWNLMFVRHRSGPLYYMYIGVHVHYLRKRRDFFAEPAMTIDDVVVDELPELLWRLRALFAVKNTLGQRIVAIGNPAGWGADGAQAPARAKEVWKFEYITVPYPELEERLKQARANERLVQHCQQQAEAYLRDAQVSLETERGFVERAFVLTEVFRTLLDEADANAITVHNCMTTIMPVSRTTACLPLTLLNDDGYLAFCESDLVAIPAGILLHYVTGKPVFFCNPSFPHKGIVTVSHCTAPRRMDGKSLAPARILTHYESDYGAAPKVEMPRGQEVTVIDPDFNGQRWLGFEAAIMDSPFFPICRTQLDLKIIGDWQRLIQEIRGFHWLLAYGRVLKTFGYAVRKAGLDWLPIEA